MRGWAVGAVLTLALGASAAAQTIQLPAKQTIPLPTTMCHTYFFVTLTLADAPGRPADRTIDLIYDTGATETLVDPDALWRAGRVRASPGQRAVIENASIGTLDVERLPARVMELDHLSVGLGREVDGILGYAAFGSFLISLDYAAGRIEVSDGALPLPDGVSVFDVRGRDRRPWIDIAIGTEKRKLLIDSGAATGLSLRHLDRYSTLGPPVDMRIAVRIDRMEWRRGARLALDVALGPRTIVTPLVAEVQRTELLGGDIMRHFRWTFDPKNARVQMVPLNDAPILIGPERTLGLAFQPRADAFEVVRVLPGGPAGEDGFRPGDIVTHMNGLPIRERGCGRLGRSPILRLTRLRDGVSADVDVPVYDIVD